MEQTRFPGMDEGLQLYHEWLRIFGKNGDKLRFSKTRERAANKGLAEADVATCVRALEGFYAWRKVKPGGTDLTDLFSTYRNTSDMASRISFFAEYAEKAREATTPSALLEGIPSAQRSMVRERQRHVEAMLLNPNNEALRVPGELAESYLRETVGLVAFLHVDGRAVRWERRAA